MKKIFVALFILFSGTIQAQSVCGADYDKYKKEIVYDSVYYSRYYKDLVREVLLHAYNKNCQILTIKIVSEGDNCFTQIQKLTVIKHPEDTRVKCVWEPYYGNYKLNRIFNYNENGNLVSGKSIYPDGSVRYLFDETVEPPSKIKYVQGALIPKIKYVNSFPAFFKKRYEKGEVVE